ncbi:MAG TPA: hypothetical protein VM198_14940 [Longimicrobiales bacterium]|nr:hypothetical protein [Longimicrobiales bacterium]
MSDTSPLPPAPTKSKLVLGHAGRAAAGGRDLVTVLPAEYDIDPLATGEALGLATSASVSPP